MLNRRRRETCPASALVVGMAGEMKRLSGSQPLVARRKPLRRLLDGAEGAGFALGGTVELVDPSRHLLVDRRRSRAGQEGSVQNSKARHPIRIGSGKGQRDHAAQRMTNDGSILQRQGTRQAAEVIDVISETVAASFRPF